MICLFTVRDREGFVLAPCSAYSRRTYENRYKLTAPSLLRGARVRPALRRFNQVSVWVRICRMKPEIV